MFESQFPRQWAEEIIARMQRYHRAKFNNTFPIIHGQSVEDYQSDLIDTACEVFEGLTADDIKRGLPRLKTAVFCPTFPEFRSWCEPSASAWLSADEAWAVSRASIDTATGAELTVIWTEQAARAFDRCADIVRNGDKYQLAEARKIFVATYDRLVAEAKDQGQKPVYQVSLGADKDQRAAAIREAEIDGRLPAPQAALLLEHNQTPDQAKQEGRALSTFAQQTLAEIREQLGQRKSAEPAVVLGSKPVAEFIANPMQWPDPFENPNEYLQMLQREGRTAPRCLNDLGVSA